MLRTVFQRKQCCEATLQYSNATASVTRITQRTMSESRGHRPGDVAFGVQAAHAALNLQIRGKRRIRQRLESLMGEAPGGRDECSVRSLALPFGWGRARRMVSSCMIRTRFSNKHGVARARYHFACKVRCVTLHRSAVSMLPLLHHTTANSFAASIKIILIERYMRYHA